MKNTVSFYQQTWFILLMLVLLFPIGFILMWRYTFWTQKQKLGLSLICILLLCICINNLETMNNFYSSSKATQVSILIEENKKLEKPAKQYIQHVINAKILRIDSSTLEKGVIVSIDATVKSQDEAKAFAKETIEKLDDAPVPIVKYNFTFSTSQGMPVCSIFKNADGFQFQGATNTADSVFFE